MTSSNTLIVWLCLMPSLLQAQMTPQPVDQAAGAQKQDVPDERSQAAARDVVAQIFKSEYESAKTFDAKAALAQKMLKVAGDTSDDPVGRYVLLRIGKDIAVEAGDLVTAFDCISELDRTYSVHRLAMQEEAAKSTITNMGRTAQRDEALDRLRAAIDDAVEADEYALAKSLVASAVNCARDGRMSAQAHSIQKRAEEIETISDEFSKIAIARTTLESNPQDSDANLQLGKFLCFVKNDWQQGLVALALSPDGELQNLAAQELGDDPDALSIGDTWWDIADQMPERSKQLTRSHAALWYRKVLPELAGLTKVRIEERLQHIPQPKPASTAKEPSVRASTNHESTESKWQELLISNEIKQIALADLVKRGPPNAWNWSKSGLTCLSDVPTRVEFPFEFPNEYEMAIDLTVSGQQVFSDVHIALPIGNKSVPFTVRRKDRKTLISFWGGRGFGEDPKIGTYLPWVDGAQRHVVSFVVQNGRIEVRTQGKAVLKIEDIDYVKQELGNALAITTTTSVSIHAIRLAEVGEGLPMASADRKDHHKDEEYADRHVVKFDGIQSYGVVPSYRHKGGHPVTIEAKILCSQNVVSFPIATSTGADGLSIQVDEKNWIFSVGSPRKPVHLFSGPASPVVKGQWVHVAGVFDGSQAWLFINGKLRDTKMVQGGYLPSDAPLYFGVKRSSVVGKTWYFNGSLKEVRISKIARYTKDFDVQERMEADKDTLLFFPFEEGKGNTAADASGNGHTAKLWACEWQ